MKSVTWGLRLRRYSKSLVAALLLLLFAFAGSGFKAFSYKAAPAKAKYTDVKNARSLFSANLFNPAMPCFTQLTPQAIPFVQRYMKNEGESLQRMKLWGKRYFDMYDGIFAQYGLPEELKYLSVIESELKHKIRSPAGAVGPWQIMPSEARRVGLKVNGSVDERTDFDKSTQAAAKLLKELHSVFGDWLLVVAAYNCGEVNVRRAIKKCGSKNFWELQKYLPAQTRAHVKRFIGTQYIFEGGGGLTTMTAHELLNS